MKRIQVIEIGRGARELNNYAVLPGRDAQALLAQELEFHWNRIEEIIKPVPGETDSYVILRKPSLIGGKRTIKVRIVEVGFTEDEATRELPPFDMSEAS